MRPAARASAPAPAPARSGTAGRLFLVPAPLDFGCDEQVPLQGVVPQGTLLAASRLQYWICENAKSLRAYLKRVDVLQPLSTPLQSLHIQELPRAVHKKGDHNGEFDATPLLAPALSGNPISGAATGTRIAGRSVRQ